VFNERKNERAINAGCFLVGFMGLAEFVVVFREVFEIALVLGIMLVYLKKTKNTKHSRMVYLGGAAGIIASVLAAAGFEIFAGGFEAHEALFEGITLVVAAALVTWLNLWMFAQKNISKSIEKGVKARIGKREDWGLALFAFIAVFREGVEMVLFLYGISVSTGAISAVSALFGAVAALALCYAMFLQATKLNLHTFFVVTSIMLVVLAAGLLSQGVHELQEAHVLPETVEHIYDITPVQNADGSYPMMHEKGAIGSALKGLIGYATAPTLEQVAAYAGYLAFVFFAYRRISSS
jgi:high-affinity iron transporter